MLTDACVFLLLDLCLFIHTLSVFFFSALLIKLHCLKYVFKVNICIGPELFVHGIEVREQTNLLAIYLLMFIIST